jgi:hypothetical protein
MHLVNNNTTTTTTTQQHNNNNNNTTTTVPLVAQFVLGGIYKAWPIVKNLKAFEGRDDLFLKPPAEQMELLKKDNVVFCRFEPA